MEAFIREVENKSSKGKKINELENQQEIHKIDEFHFRFSIGHQIVFPKSARLFFNLSFHSLVPRFIFIARHSK